MTPEKEWMLSLIDPFFKVSKDTPTPNTIEIPKEQKPEAVDKRYQTLKASYSIQTYKVLSSSFPSFYKNTKKEIWSALGKEFVTKHAMKEPQLGLIADHFYNFCSSKDLANESLLHLQRDWTYRLSKRSKFNSSACIKDIAELQQVSLLGFQKTVFAIEPLSLVISRDEKEVYDYNLDKPQLKILSDWKEKEFTLLELAELLETEQMLADFFSKAIQGRWLLSKD